MRLKSLALVAALVAAGTSTVLTSAPAFAQAKDQFFPVLSAIAPAPTRPTACRSPTAIVDYLKLINAKGGINGVKVSWEECETGYATDKGVECYERLKGKTAAQPRSSRCPPASPSR